MTLPECLLYWLGPRQGELALANGIGTTLDTQELPTEGQATTTHDENIADMMTEEGKSFDLIFECPNYQLNNY
jgi:hypothetical protein